MTPESKQRRDREVRHDRRARKVRRAIADVLFAVFYSRELIGADHPYRLNEPHASALRICEARYLRKKRPGEDSAGKRTKSRRKSGWH